MMDICVFSCQCLGRGHLGLYHMYTLLGFAEPRLEFGTHIQGRERHISMLRCPQGPECLVGQPRTLGPHTWAFGGQDIAHYCVEWLFKKWRMIDSPSFQVNRHGLEIQRREWDT